MADPDETGETDSPPPAGKDAKGKKKDHKQGLLIAASVAGVLIAWLTYKKISGGSSASTAVTTASPGAGSVAGQASDSSALQSVTSYLTQLSSQVDQLGQAQQQGAQQQAQALTDAQNGFQSYLGALGGQLTDLQGAVSNAAAPTATPLTMQTHLNNTVLAADYAPVQQLWDQYTSVQQQLASNPTNTALQQQAASLATAHLNADNVYLGQRAAVNTVLTNPSPN